MSKLYLSRKRTVIINKKRFFTFILISSLVLNFIIFGIVSPGQSRATEVKEPVTITVKSGDTLWSIADEYCENKRDIRDMICRIKQVNSLSSADLYVGQTLEIPSEF